MNTRSYEYTDAGGPVTTDIAPQPRYMSNAEARDLFDQRARELLGMSGEEFKRRWDAGEIEEPDRSEVLQVWMLLPWAE